MQGVIPRPDVAPILQQNFVALAADADEMENEVIELARHLRDATMLPFVIFADSNGKFLGGSSGMVNPATFVKTLQQLTKAG